MLTGKGPHMRIAQEQGHARSSRADMRPSSAPVLIARHRSRQRNRKVLSALAIVAVLATAIALMVPVISMTHGDLVCGLEEHQHTDACYEQTLSCELEEGDEHQHTDACYERELACDKQEHAHSDACYAAPTNAEKPNSSVTKKHEDNSAPAKVKGDADKGKAPASGTVSASGKTYGVTVAYGKSAEIPAGADLKVKEIPSSSSEFGKYAKKAEHALGIDEGAAV